MRLSIVRMTTRRFRRSFSCSRSVSHLILLKPGSAQFYFDTYSVASETSAEQILRPGSRVPECTDDQRSG
jgi:hypothetical protein